MRLRYRAMVKNIRLIVLSTGLLAASLIPAFAAQQGEATPAWPQRANASFKHKATVPRIVRVNVIGGTRSGSYRVGAKIKIVAKAPAKGMEFDRWDGPVSEPSSRSTTLVVPSSAVTVTAVFAEAGRPKEVAVRVEDGSGSGSYRPGARLTIAALPAPDGMVFAGWTGDIAGLADPMASPTTYIVPNSSARLAAIYRQAPVSEVDITVAGGSGSGRYKPGATISIAAAPASAGQVFAGWTGDIAGLADPTSPATTYVVPGAAARLAASYRQAPVREVDVTVAGGTGSGRYKPGATISIAAAPASTGKVFAAWTGDIAGLSNPQAPTSSFIVPAKSAAITATYADAPVPDIEVTVKGGTGSGRYKPGAVVTLYAFAGPVGQVFDKWDGPVATPADSITALTVPAQNVTITASYKAGATADIVLTVKGGSGSGAYKPGTTVRITADAPPAGKVFKGWLGDSAAIRAPSAPATDYRLGDREASVEATFGDPIFSLTSHQDGAAISTNGETVFGHIDAAKLDQVDRLAVSTGPDERIIDISKTGMFAFRVFREVITAGQPVEITLTAYLSDSTSSSYTYRFTPVETSGALQQALGRITYGATPALLAELKTKSFNDFVREQLNPNDADPNEVSLKTTYGDPLWTEINANESFATESLDGLRLSYAVTSKWQLREVMTRFWDNHFHTAIAEAFHKEKQRNIDAYRANAFGQFKDLLSISANSSLMMMYLTNNNSSDAAINENYGRELLELHSVGIDGGYTPDDIRTVARIMAGRSYQLVARTFNNVSVREYIFNFDSSRHANNVTFSLPFIGAGFTVGPRPRAQGLQDGEDLVAALARHPSTQRFVCGKLVEYLVSDDRPQEFIDLCVTTWAQTDGNIKSILEAMLTNPRYIGVAGYQRSKMKTPFEYAVGMLRNYPFAFKTGRALPALKSMRDIWINAGMDILSFPVPTGFKEKATDWNAPASLIARFGAATDRINGASWPSVNATQNFAGLLTAAPTPMVTAQAAAAYLLALGTADRFDRDEFDAVVAALKGTDGLFDPTVATNGVSAEEPAVRKAISLILTLPSYQIQ